MPLLQAISSATAMNAENPSFDGAVAGNAVKPINQVDTSSAHGEPLGSPPFQKNRYNGCLLLEMRQHLNDNWEDWSELERKE